MLLAFVGRALFGTNPPRLLELAGIGFATRHGRLPDGLSREQHVRARGEASTTRPETAAHRVGREPPVQPEAVSRHLQDDGHKDERFSPGVTRGIHKIGERRHWSD